MRHPEQIIGKDAVVQLAFEGYDVVPSSTASDIEIEAYRYGRDLVAAKLANWMISKSLATGQGDRFDDLLRELDWQFDELRHKAGGKP